MFQERKMTFCEMNFLKICASKTTFAENIAFKWAKRDLFT